jgi:membrane protease YdiL (CAAX protease family)
MPDRRKGVLWYIVLSFGIAWLLWEIPIRLGLSPLSPLFQLAALPGAFAPAISAIIVRRWITREGFADAGLRLNLKANWRHYLLAWLLPVPVTLIVVALAWILGLSTPDFSLARVASMVAENAEVPPVPSYLWALLPLQLLLNSLLVTPLLWGEEFGWRGYLQLRLFAGRPLLAALSTGMIWSLWHLPLNLRGYNFPNQPVLGMVVFTVGTVLLSIIFGWLRLKTGSIWPASLAHAATNAFGGSMTLLLFAGDPQWIFVSYLGLLGWLPLGALCAWIVASGRLRTATRACEETA